jgi:hypothetical protein
MYPASCNSVNCFLSSFNSSTDILYGRLEIGAVPGKSSMTNSTSVSGGVGVSRPGGSLSRRVNVAACPNLDGSTRGRARRGGSEVAGDGRERGENPAAFVFVPRPGRVRLQ